VRYNLEVSSDPLVGALIGRYRVERLLGRGGMGRVYLGIHTEIGSRVAIKVLAEDLADSADLLERFFAEARTVNLIHHENIIAVIDLDRMANGRPYIVMEYIEGASLRELIDAGPPPLGGVVHAMLEVLLALGAAHAAGIVHRDLKPDNVMLASSGRAKVLDFGIAKLVAEGPRTRTGARLGTPEYMAPEQILGAPVDTRADLYAAGVMLFELCTGERPFAGATDYQLMEGHLRASPPSARVLRPEVGAALDAVITQALAKRPDDRFRSATAMANALRHAAAELGPEAWRPLIASATTTSPSFDTLPRTTEAEAEAIETAPALPPIQGRLEQRTRTLGPDRAPPPPAPAPAPDRPRARRRGWLAIGVVAIAAGGLAISTQLHGPAAPSPGDARALDAPADRVVVAPPIDAMVDQVVEAVIDARTVIAARDAGPPRDATAKPAGQALGPGWEPDPVWGFDPPIQTEPTVPPRHKQRFSHTLVGVTGETFDPAAWAPVALKLARELEPDARLTGFDVQTDATGKVWWNRDRNARMWFASAAATAAHDPARLPCIYVFPTPSGVGILRSDDTCVGPAIPLPRCRLADVFPGKVQAHAGARTISIEYGAKGWRVTQSNGEPADSSAKDIARDDVPDTCAP
jgi:predicted Ser/Thr protein kinase